MLLPPKFPLAVPPPGSCLTNKQLPSPQEVLFMYHILSAHARSCAEELLVQADLRDFSELRNAIANVADTPGPDLGEILTTIGFLTGIAWAFGLNPTLSFSFDTQGVPEALRELVLGSSPETITEAELQSQFTFMGYGGG